MLFNLIDHFQDKLESLGLWPYLQVLYQEEFRALAAVLLAFILVMCFGRRTIAWLVRMKVGDAPEFNHSDLNDLMKSRGGTPTMGGILICGAILVSMLLLADLSNRYVQLAIVVLLWLSALGAFDDWLKLTAARRNPGSRDGLFPWEKLLFQLGLGLVVGVFVFQAAGAPDALVLNLPFQRTYPPAQLDDTLQLPMALSPSVLVLPGIVFIAIAVFFIAGFSNAVNLTDGMDGLAAGIIAISALVLMVLAWLGGEPRASAFLMIPYVEGSQELTVVAGAMVGACIGFLWFNVSPASVFMGDTGSLPLRRLARLHRLRHPAGGPSARHRRRLHHGDRKRGAAGVLLQVHRRQADLPLLPHPPPLSSRRMERASGRPAVLADRRDPRHDRVWPVSSFASSIHDVL